jgi:hypothetical protein
MKLARTSHRDRDAEAAAGTRRAAVRRARGMLASLQPQRRLSDELIAERRAEAHAGERAGR